MSHIVPVPKRHRLALPIRSLVALGALAVLAATGIILAVTASRASKSPTISHQVSVDPLTKLGVKGTPGSASQPSGVAVPTGNLPGWKQVFRDNFTTSVPAGGFSNCSLGKTILTSDCAGLPASVGSQLFAYPDGWPDHHSGQYMPSQVLSIHNGMLDYYLHTSPSGIHEVAAVVPKIPGGVGGNGLQYGAYAVRFKAQTISSYKTAFLLWPDSEVWPADGEIDFPEGDLDGYIDAAMHMMGGTSMASQDPFETKVGYSSWHTAVIEWTPTICRFILDGRVVGSSTSLIPSTPMHWVLQAETVRGAAPADSISGHIYVAWIAAYTRAA
jgi:hypothetical protein